LAAVLEAGTAATPAAEDQEAAQLAMQQQPLALAQPAKDLQVVAVQEKVPDIRLVVEAALEAQAALE
jgi:hypothetical protein